MLLAFFPIGSTDNIVLLSVAYKARLYLFAPFNSFLFFYFVKN